MKSQWTFHWTHALLLLTSVGQILLTIYLYTLPVADWVRNLGWVCLWLSAIFGWLPIITFKRFGGVKEKKSYIHTTLMVDRGIYSIVRHPQYLAGILISLGLFLIAPHWGNALLGVLNTCQYNLGTYPEEKDLVEKFGTAYCEYRQRVPRLNFILGLIRKLINSNRHSLIS